jgi:hypothetical protein
MSEKELDYIGKDGKMYHSMEEVDRANETYRQNMGLVEQKPPLINKPFIGPDGKSYDTVEGLIAAEQAHKELTYGPILPPKVLDGFEKEKINPTPQEKIMPKFNDTPKNNQPNPPQK